MKKLLLLIISLVSLSLSITVAYADDCTSSLYEKDFNCKTKDTYSYCTPDAKLKRTGPKFNLYETSYCNLLQNNDDEIYGIIAEQFKAEDPKMDKNKIKAILTDKPAGIYDRVKIAYQKEKIMNLTQKSLEQKFQASEMWYNATLSDSPFDLIVDLNLIEIVLFGSQAKWQSSDDIWKWPKDSDSTQTAETGITPGETPTGPETPATEPGGAEEPAPTGDNPIDDYECVPDDILDDLLGDTGGEPDTGTNPPGIIPVSCGNSKLDTGETCDDGNNIAGDGCSESCQKEAGADLSCKDNEAVTFKQLSKTSDNKAGGGKTGGAGGGNNPGAGPAEVPPLDCPPGSTATKKSSTQEEKEAQVQQSPNYPGPFVGGVLKNFPPSEQTDCPPGETYTQVSAAGESAGMCFPTKFCSDLESARKMLFGVHYKDDPVTNAAAASLEVSVCVEIKMITRPESPYPLNEGCIDCNIMAMNDIMSKLLDKNVTPLQNSMQSWGSSNRWGPTISFNLNVLAKRMVNAITSPKYEQNLGQQLTDVQKAQKAKQDICKEAKKSIDCNVNSALPQPAKSSEDMNKTLEGYWTDVQKKSNLQSEFLQNYAMAGDASADQLAYGGIIGKLRELKASFERMKEEYVQLAAAVKFSQKEKCK